jgi:hypothetical protein
MRADALLTEPKVQKGKEVVADEVSLSEIRNEEIPDLAESMDVSPEENFQAETS